MQPTSHKPPPEVSTSSSLGTKEKEKLTDVALDKINEAVDGGSALSLLGRKFSWLKNQVGDFFIWIDSLINRLTGHNIQLERSDLPLIENPLKAGDKISFAQLNDAAIPNHNEKLSFKAGDLIAFPIGLGNYEFKVYTVESVNNNGGVVIKLDQWNTSTIFYDKNRIWKLKSNIEYEEPTSHVFHVGDIITEDAIDLYASKKATGPSLNDFVAVKQGDSYRVYQVIEIKKDGKYGIHGTYIADSYLADRSQIIRLKKSTSSF